MPRSPARHVRRPFSTDGANDLVTELARESATDSASAMAMDSADLVERARAGDDRAFSELARRYRPGIRALALQLTGDADDADDIAQDAFLCAYRKLGDFRAASEFSTWVHRIALNLSLNEKRSRGRRRLEDLDDPRLEPSLPADVRDDPRKTAELRQIYAQLVGALDRLSTPLRSAVVLIALHGLSHEQAAEELSCSPGTVAWRMHRARRELAEAIRPRRTALPREDDSGIFLLLPDDER